MKRKNQSPREYSLQHCKDRARERYDFELLDNDYDILSNKIREDLAVEGTFPRLKQVNREGSQYTFIVSHRNTQFVCVFDVRSALLKTLLPPEQFSANLS